MSTRFTQAALAAMLAATLVSNPSRAADVTAGSLRIQHPMARATTPGQQTSGAYMTIVNNGPSDRLISATSPVAVAVELHEMRMEGDVMKMRRVDGIDLGSGKTVELKPGAFHVMFLGLKSPLVDGTSLPLTLHFEKAGDVDLQLPVEASAGAAR